jgi:hypothetical protein
MAAHVIGLSLVMAPIWSFMTVTALRSNESVSPLEPAGVWYESAEIHLQGPAAIGSA